MEVKLPTDTQARKEIPIATGCLDYFPDALAAIAELSKHGNDKHNPGQPLHWSRGKSDDHPDCALRHFTERGKWDVWENGVKVRHSTQAAWRMLAVLQLEIEADRAKKVDNSRVDDSKYTGQTGTELRGEERLVPRGL